MIILTNAFLCLLIAIRLFTFDRDDCRYKVMYGWLAWLMISSSTAVFVFSFFGLFSHAYDAQAVMNFALFVCLLRTKGNIAQTYYTLKPRKKAKQR